VTPGDFEVHLGFSTTRGLLSRLIRWGTSARASHCFLVYPSDVFGCEMVLEATGAGFRVLSWKRFDRGNRLIAVYRLKLSPDCLRGGMTLLAPRLGDAYDSWSLVGYLLRSWFSLRRVPFNSRTKLVCSEAVALYLRHCGVDVGDVRVVTPRDLLDLAHARPDVFELRESGRAFRRLLARRAKAPPHTHRDPR
jgi:hypothetical protein